MTQPEILFPLNKHSLNESVLNIHKDVSVQNALVEAMLFSAL